MIDWTFYIRRYRRFEHHTFKEVAMQYFLPNDLRELVSIVEVEHEVFDLTTGGLYNPEINRPHQQGEISGFIVENSVLWPSVGAIRTSGGKLIAESFFNETSRNLALKRGYTKRFPSIRVHGAVATIGHLYRNYYHRWADSIPRIYALYHPCIRLFGNVKLFIDKRFTPEEMHVIQHLVPRNVNVISVDPPVRVQADQCIHLPYLSTNRVYQSKWFNASAGFLPIECLNWMREQVYALMGIHPKEPFRKLFVTRRYAKLRRLLNEEEVATHLKRHGFEVVALELMPFHEQVQRFAEAKIIVAQHGAGLINLIFAQSSRVLEILSNQDQQIFFRYISEALGFPHIQLPLNGKNKNANVVLPIDLLKKTISELSGEH